MLTARRAGTLAALAALGVLASLSVSGSLAMLGSSAGAKTSAYTAGTVTLTSASTSTCTLGTGPGAAQQCTYSLSYAGSVPAWVGLDVSTNNAGGASGLSITGDNPSQSFDVGNDQIVGNGPVSDGFSDTITVACPAAGPPAPKNDPCAPPPSCGPGNMGQCSSLTVTLQAHAVQAANNTSNGQPVSWG